MFVATRPIHKNAYSPVSSTVAAVEILVIKWALARENLSSGFANSTGADQPAPPRRLISAFVIR